IDTVCASSVPLKTIKEMTRLPNVVMVELQPELRSYLDTSSPAVRSRASNKYSPYSAMDLGYSGRDVVIAIIDTGVDDTIHQSLRGKFVGGADLAGVVMINNTNPDDDFGHGTHVAGIAMGDGGTDGTYMGTAPNASLVDVRIGLGVGGDLMQGMEWVMDNKESKNISIVSISVGSQGNSDGTDALSRDANTAVDMGMVVLSSAGNDGQNYLSAPAAADKVLAVAASNDQSTINRDDDYIAGFSNYGPRRDDGDTDKIDELKPEITGHGVNIMAPMHNTRDSYIAFSGTSMSCPMVAGVAALMLEANPDLTPADVRQILLESAEARGSPSYSDLSSKYNIRYGFGIVDAYGAVKRAANLRSGNFQGPTDVDGGKEYDFKFDFELTRTEYTSEKNNIEIDITIPGSWSEPGDIQFENDAGTSGISNTYEISGPEKSGGVWQFEITGTYSGTLSTPENLNPEISFKTSAPDNTPGDEDYIFTGTLSINDMKGATVNHEINVEPMQTEIDLSVDSSSITFSNENPVFGEDVVITAKVNNSGDADARSVMVNFTDGPPRTGREIGSDVINTVPAGGSGEARVTWTATPGVHTIYVEVDPMNAIEETNENNNLASSQPIVVQGGVNNPPVAMLEVIPREAAIGSPVTFDGSGSFDTDGDVVKYLFDFGDGKNSSWIDNEMTQHIYESNGTYLATLRVEDNGGQRSVPDSAVVNVTKQEGGVKQYYFYLNYNLLETQPVSNSDNFVTVKSSTEGSIIPQWQYIGNWSTKGILPSMDIENTATFFGWVQNKGNTPVNLMQLEFTLKVNNENITDAAVGRVTNLTPGGDPESVSVTADITNPPRRIKPEDVITVQVRSMVNSNDVVFVFESFPHDTRVEFNYKLPPLIAPVAEAGDDATIYVNQELSFNGQGIDSDGQIVLNQWDFEGDGVFDWESTENGITTHTYTQSGMYMARFQVHDDDGLTAFDERKITVNSGAPNQAPTVDITAPQPNQQVKDTVTVEGYAEDDMNVEKVQLKFNQGAWLDVKLETIGSGMHTWQYEWDTTAYPNGFNTITARSYDGELYSAEKSVSVDVSNEDLPPEILSASVKPTSVPADDDSLVRITVEVYDDGPLEDLYVIVDLRPIGGSKSTEMYDDGSHGDKTSGDGQFNIRTTIPTDVEPGEKTLEISVEDLSGGFAKTEVELEVTESGTPGINNPPEILSPVAEPTIVPNDGTTEVVLKVTVQDQDGLEDLQSVIIDLSPIGGSSSTLMSDNGESSGDEVAGDGIFTFTTVVGTSIEPGEKDLTVIVTDQSSETAISSITIVVELPKVEEEESGVGATDWFYLLTSPTVLFIFGLVIILIIVGVLVRTTSRSKKAERVAQGRMVATSLSESQEAQEGQSQQMEL
ncbi:MAG: S8 family serine peptidase, partial [Thermoplasmata archaeon]